MKTRTVLEGLIRTIGVMVLCFALGAGLAWLHLWASNLGSQRSPEGACMHHLKVIGGLILMRQAEGNLKRVPGARFLLQTVEQVKSEDLEVFRCSARPGSRR